MKRPSIEELKKLVSKAASVAYMKYEGKAYSPYKKEIEYGKFIAYSIVHEALFGADSNLHEDTAFNPTKDKDARYK